MGAVAVSPHDKRIEDSATHGVSRTRKTLRVYEVIVPKARDISKTTLYRT